MKDIDSAWTEAAPDWLVEWVDRIPKDKALDIGAGTGPLSLWLAARGFDVEAVEKDHRAARRLRRMADQGSVQVVERGIEEIQLPRRRYTLILAAASLHFLHPADLRALSGRLMNALRPGGYLLAEVFTTDDPGSDVYRDAAVSPLAPNTYPLAGGEGLIHYFEPGELRRLFEDLEVLSYEESRRITADGEYGYRAGATIVGRRPKEA